MASELVFVQNRHLEYTEILPDYEMIYDVIKGERRMKAQGTKYVPKLGGQKPEDYKPYVDRGYFYGATARTVLGLVGAMMRRKPIIKINNKDVEKFVTDKSVTIDGTDIYSLISVVCDYLISYGRAGIMVDYVSEKPVFTFYKAYDIWNWAVSVVDGVKKIMRLVLHEVDDEVVDDEIVLVEYAREIFIDDSGYVVNRLYRKNEDKKGDFWTLEEETFPSILGVRIKDIPFVCFGPIYNVVDNVAAPPILDLSNLNVAHWKLTVDYFHGLHFCALPTPYICGFNQKAKYTIGPANMLVSSNPEARAGMLEFTGQGMTSVEKALDRIERQMSIIGARLLEDTKTTVESAETQRERAAGESVSLTTIATSVGNGMEKAITYAAKWMRIDEINPIVEMNKDFIPSNISPQLIIALLQAVQSGKISINTFLYNMQRYDVLPEDRKIEEERALIEIDLEDAIGASEEFSRDEKKEKKPSEMGTPAVAKYEPIDIKNKIRPERTVLASPDRKKI
jgi:hypothetical protein